MSVAVLIVEFIILYLISRALTQTMFLFFLRVTRNKHIALSAITILLFPGTVIHELAHLFTAEVLGVPTGKLTLVPEGLETSDDGEQEIKTGSVAIAKTGPFRRAIIGIAPVIIGLAALGVLAYFLTTATETLWLAVIGYLLFAVSNSLFSSPEDLVGFWPIAITLVLLMFAAWFAGFRIALTGPILTLTMDVVASLVRSLAFVLALNFILLLLMRVLLALTRKPA